jgi:hypothetical protein
MVYEKVPFDSMSKGLIKGNKVALNSKLKTNSEKACVLSEELGHFFTSQGNIINLKEAKNRKQEYKARLWAFNKQVGLIGIINAFDNRCRNIFEMAEYLDVTEDFLRDAIECYRKKYGICTKLDNYIIYFEPYLSVIKML